MKLTVLYDADGTKTIDIEGHHITTQLFHDCNGSAVVNVYNKKRKKIKTFHFGKVYLMEKTL